MIKPPFLQTFTVIAALLVLCTSTAMGQFPGLRGSPQVSEPAERVDVSIAVYEGVMQPGSTATLGVRLRTQTKWKIQAGLGSGDEVEPFLPTTVDVTLPEGWTAGRVHWPEAKTFTIGDEHYSEQSKGYDGTVLVAVPINVPADAAPGEFQIEVQVSYQACDDRVCEQLVTLTEQADVRVVLDPSEADAPPLDDALAALFVETLSRPQPEQTPADEPEPAASQQADAVAVDAPGGSTFFGISVPKAEGLLGLLLLAVMSALGGFVLNLTPCVLPVIPIKIMTLQHHANHPGKTLVLGLWMFAGVVVFWAAIGLPVAFFAGVTDPSQVFGIWWVTFGIGAIIALMGIGIMGMFTIQLPQSVYAINPKADTPTGSFVFGVMTAVLGLPCFGFVAGALLAGSATLPPSTIMLIFTSLGVGMGLPYLVLSAKPSLVDSLPRTGPASELVKQVMGLLLLAAAAYFIGSGLIALVSERPYLARQLHWWTVAVFAVVAAVWLIIRTFQITTRVGPRLSFAVVGLIIGGVALLYALDSTGKAKANWEIQQAAAASASGYLTGYWNNFTPAAFEQARADDRIVVLDFTAEWCLICKYLKATVLERDPVQGQLNAEDVVKFTVDLTSNSDPGWDFLRDLGQTGIPLLVIYTPGREQPWQANAYTSPQVIEALSQARAANGGALAYSE